uniref:Uncharacterized protein n=1 Tax=viral metagenome TaxID=1070528 RepID=A0A6M3JSR3_9ZZZZ
MVQYPDSIVITTAASGWQNASGVWTAGATGTYTFDCRAEVNGTGRKIVGNDGALIDYAFQVFLPVMTVVIPPASDFVLTALSNGTITGKIKRASNGQLNSRLWL